MQPLVVTTAHRGVFFGYGEITTESVIRLKRVRMCVYWPPDNKGVLGLASEGPLKGAKVGPAIPGMTLRDVTGVMEITEAAVKRWESAPWS